MTMTQSDYELLLSRFYGLCDGLIRLVQLRYTEDGTREVELDIACRDSETTVNEGWVSVRVVIRNATEFTLVENPKTTLQVLSDGLQIQVFGDVVGIEFGGNIDAPYSLDDLRKSRAYAIGTCVDFEVGDY